VGLYEEPIHHGIGRSRGGLSSKIHQLVDGRGRPLVVLVGPGQAHDSPMFPVLLALLRVDRRGPGRPRTTPDAVLGDKAYSARARPAPLARRQDRDPRTVRPDPQPQTPRRTRRPTTRLRRRGLPRPQRGRTILQHRQAMARTGHPLRQARHRLPRRGRPTRDHHLAQTPLETRPSRGAQRSRAGLSVGLRPRPLCRGSGPAMAVPCACWVADRSGSAGISTSGPNSLHSSPT
jgi:hypothetical protein